MENKPAPPNEFILVKFGGSLITNKDRPYTALPKRIRALAKEIKRYRDHSPNIPIIIGHGSGSFGHVTAQQHQTRKGVQTSEQWQGFSDVWWDARKLNTIVVEILKEEKLPVISFPASGAIVTNNHQVQSWSLAPIQQALSQHLVPVVYGDVVMDTRIGGTILSTEEIFFYLSHHLLPKRIILLGVEPGVWSDFPAKTTILPSITPQNFDRFEQSILGSASTDVTGGMIEKVKTMLDLIRQLPGLTIQICDGITPGNLYQSLLGSTIGTVISNLSFPSTKE